MAGWEAACSNASQSEAYDDESADALTGFVCDEPELGEYRDHAPFGQVVAVRAAARPEAGFDRFVMEFAPSSGVPNYRVAKQGSSTFYQDGSGDEMKLAGGAGLHVLVERASGYDMQAGTQTFPGPRRFNVANGKSLLEAASTGDFEGQVNWGLALSHSPCFRAFKLASPPRLVIDVQR